MQKIISMTFLCLFFLQVSALGADNSEGSWRQEWNERRKNEFKEKLGSCPQVQSWDDINIFYGLSSLWQDLHKDPEVDGLWQSCLLSQEVDWNNNVHMYFVSSVFQTLEEIFKNSEDLRSYYPTLKKFSQYSVISLYYYLKLEPEQNSFKLNFLQTTFKNKAENSHEIKRIFKEYIEYFGRDSEVEYYILELKKFILNEKNDYAIIDYLELSPNDAEMIEIAKTKAETEFWFFSRYIALFPEEKEHILVRLKQNILLEKDVSQAISLLEFLPSDSDIREMIHGHLLSSSYSSYYTEMYIKALRPEEKDEVIKSLYEEALKNNTLYLLLPLIKIKGVSNVEEDILIATASRVLKSQDSNEVWDYLELDLPYFREELYEHVGDLILSHGSTYELFSEKAQKLPNYNQIVLKFRKKLMKERNPYSLIYFLQSQKEDLEIRNLLRKLLLNRNNSYVFDQYMDLYPDDLALLNYKETLLQSKKEVLEALRSSISSFTSVFHRNEKGHQELGRQLFELLSFVGGSTPRLFSEFQEMYHTYFGYQSSFSDSFAKMKYNVSKHLDFTREDVGFVLALDESMFKTPFVWLDEAIYKIHFHKDLLALHAFLIMMNARADEWSTIPFEKRQRLQKILERAYEKGVFLLSSEELSEIKKNLRISSAILELGPVFPTQSFSSEIRAEVLNLLFQINPHDSKLACLNMREDPLFTYRVLSEKGVSKSLINSCKQELENSLNTKTEFSYSKRIYLEISLLIMEKEIQDKVKKEGGVLDLIRLKLAKTESQINREILGNFEHSTELEDQWGDKIINLFVHYIEIFDKTFLIELKSILDKLPSDHAFFMSSNYELISTFLSQMSLNLESPDRRRTIAPGLEFWEFEDPSIHALHADPRRVDLRIVHADSWFQGKNLADYIKENPKSYGGLNGGFFGYRENNFLSWATRRFVGVGSESTFPVSILQTPKGLVNDSKDYWAVIGWKQNKEGEQDVYASFLKTKWFLNIGDSQFELTRKELVPYAHESLVFVSYKQQKAVVFICGESITAVKFHSDNENPDLDENILLTQNSFELTIRNEEEFSRFVEGAKINLTHSFVVPVENDHTTEDASQDSLWKSMDYIMSGDSLVLNGVSNPNFSFKDSFLRGMANNIFNTNRSTLCYLKDKHWLLASFAHASPEQLSTTLQDIGCLHAINLDGGPSSHLKLQDGTQSSTHDRQISDALLLFPKE